MSLGSPPLTPAHHDLLGGWRDILDDLHQLGATLGTVPDHCACGNASLHLTGRCPCCTSQRGPGTKDCPDCLETLARLRTSVDALVVDTIKFFPLVKLLLSGPGLSPVRPEGARVEFLIGGVARTFGRLVSAVDEFQAGCRTSHLRALKGEAAALVAAVQQLDEHLEHGR